MKPEWKVCFRVDVSAFLPFLCIRYWNGLIHLLTLLFTAAAPLFVGCVIAYIINIPMRFYERHCFHNSRKKLVIFQQVEGNLIYPRVVGTSMGLPGIWVLAAVIVGSGLGGIPGIILGVPVAVCLYRLVREDVKGGVSKCKPSNYPSTD